MSSGRTPLLRPHWIPVLVPLFLGGCGADEPSDAAPAASVSPERAAAAAATITPDDLYRRISVLAADSMRGRDTPSPELDAVAEWIGREFAAMGIAPGAGEGYVQRYALRRIAADAESSSIRFSDGGSLTWGADVMVGTGGLPREGTAEGPVVVVSGTGDPEGAFAGLPQDAQVFVFPGPSMEATRTEGWAGRSAALYDAGAAGVYLVTSMDDAAWERSAARSAAGTRVVGDLDAARTPSPVVRAAAAERVLSPSGVDVDALQARYGEGLAMAVVDELALTTTTTLTVLDDSSAPNVVGILEGSDPELRNEYVVYSAHMDHVGVRPSAEGGDSIFNGADDDASGTATIMEVAEALASLEPRPRRSFLFVIVSGEEKGLLGSGYYADHPTVPMESMVANLNADMVGRNWPDTIVAIGKEHSDLGETLNRVNEAHPEIGMTAIDDIWPDERFYFRSDHFNFARKGVPILFFFNGTHDDYHRASDEVDKIDTEKTARIGRLLLYLGLDVADRDQRPVWNPESYAEIVEGPGR